MSLEKRSFAEKEKKEGTGGGGGGAGGGVGVIVLCTVPLNKTSFQRFVCLYELWGIDQLLGMK